MSARGVLFGWVVAVGLAISCAHGSTVEEDPTDGATGAAHGGGGSTGAPGAGGEGAATGSGGSASTCEGVTCSTPPPNACADADNLTAYEPNGTCDQGQCTYPSMTVPCASGCEAGMCKGDPCAGVTCVTPPANTCADATHLTVNESPGSCSEGNCTYASHEEFCAGGCDAGVCNGDPCLGVMCNTSPAKYCVDVDNLMVFDVPGTCMGGTCAYSMHTEFCAFGCDSGACTGDPCLGVTCTTPPASYCLAQNTLRSFAQNGVCGGGSCTYAPTDQNCPNGCANGACIECQTTANCNAGNWCNTGTCVPCNTNQHCGSTCLDCVASGDVCNASSTACVDCVIDSQCPAGNYCSASACVPCNVAQHCGPTCAACSGTTPTCGGNACVCSGNSCGAYNHCVGGACAECNTDQFCGSACTPCVGPLPHCLDQGATSTCVECLTNLDCSAPEICNGNTCSAGCPAPVGACANGGNQDGACSSAYIITRATAGTPGGFHVDDTYGLCGRNNDFATVPACESGGSPDGADAAYRLFMKQGESAHVVLTRGSSTCTIGWNGTISLKIYGTACSPDCTSCPQTCATQHFCAQDNTQDIVFVAPSSGWYVIVVDSRGSENDDVGGVFDLVVQLTCQGSCTCP